MNDPLPHELVRDRARTDCIEGCPRGRLNQVEDCTMAVVDVEGVETTSDNTKADRTKMVPIRGGLRNETDMG